MGEDETLSQTLIKDFKVAADHWKALEPLAKDLENVVKEYRGLIDGVSTIFGVVGMVWGVYSSMEKAKEEAAERQDMIDQITRAGKSWISVETKLATGTMNDHVAVNGMIERATDEVKRYMDEKEVQEAIDISNGVQQGFIHDIMPIAKTFPLSADAKRRLENKIDNARYPIERLHALIARRAQVGDGAACIMLYRNLHAIVQCKLMMDKWRYGITPTVLEQAEYETSRLIQRWGSSEGNVAGCLWLQSDLAFSPGIVHSQTENPRGPQLSRYYYTYKGISQGSNSNLAPIQQAFIAHRKRARDEAVLNTEVQGWSVEAYKAWKQVLFLQGKGD